MKTCSLDDVLSGGEWVRHGLVWHWEATAPTAPTEEADELTADYRPCDLIACPTCHARMDERCKKRDGSHRRSSHGRRLVRRVCSCGGPVRSGEPMCGFCRAEMAIEAAA